MKRTVWLLFASALVSAPSSAQTSHQHGSHATSPQDAAQLGEIDFPNSGKLEAQAEKVAKRVVQKGKQALEDARDKLEKAEADKAHGPGR